MIIRTGNKVHVVYRALFEKSTRRHFLGEVIDVEGAICRLEGYAFVFNINTTMFEKKPDKRTTIIDLAESGYVVNLIDSRVILEDVCYTYRPGAGLIATDNEKFELDINEFGVKS